MSPNIPFPAVLVKTWPPLDVPLRRRFPVEFLFDDVPLGKGTDRFSSDFGYFGGR